MLWYHIYKSSQIHFCRGKGHFWRRILYYVTENSCSVVIKVSGSFSVLLFSLKLSLNWKLLCSLTVRNITALSDCLAIQHNQEHSLFNGSNLQVSINSQNAQPLLGTQKNLTFFEGLHCKEFLQNQGEVEKNLFPEKLLCLDSSDS